MTEFPSPGRSVPEWIGRSADDWPPPKACQRRVFCKQSAHCPICTREMRPGNMTLDHRRALALGGENREANLQWICTEPCSRKKSGEETSTKAQSDRRLDRHLGLKTPSETRRPRRRIRGWRKCNGDIVWAADRHKR